MGLRGTDVVLSDAEFRVLGVLAANAGQSISGTPLIRIPTSSGNDCDETQAEGYVAGTRAAD